MNKHLSIFNQLRPVTVGFDNIFDHFESMFDNEVFSSTYKTLTRSDRGNYFELVRLVFCEF